MMRLSPKPDRRDRRRWAGASLLSMRTIRRLGLSLSGAPGMPVVPKQCRRRARPPPRPLLRRRYARHTASRPVAPNPPPSWLRSFKISGPVSVQVFAHAFGRLRAGSRPLWITGRHESGQSDHIVLGKFGDDRLHQRHGVAFPRSMLDVVELAEDINRAAAGQSRHIAHALVVRAMTDAALEGFAVSAGCRERLSRLDTA